MKGNFGEDYNSYNDDQFIVYVVDGKKIRVQKND